MSIEGGMVERVARALEAADPDSIGWEAWVYEKMARAAIEAMLEPTEVMIDAGEQVAVQPFIAAGQFTPETWRRMITAALGDGQGDQ